MGSVHELLHKSAVSLEQAGYRIRPAQRDKILVIHDKHESRTTKRSAEQLVADGRADWTDHTHTAIIFLTPALLQLQIEAFESARREKLQRMERFFGIRTSPNVYGASGKASEYKESYWQGRAVMRYWPDDSETGRDTFLHACLSVRPRGDRNSSRLRELV